ncbi:hypothetical protein MMC08_006660 [Hypocenomyce scalaris]|nr:hypothetical protein [Hypocenomyce scalaris]
MQTATITIHGKADQLLDSTHVINENVENGSGESGPESKSIVNGPLAQHPLSNQPKFLYLIGEHTTHSYGSPIHNHIARALCPGHTFINQDCSSIAEATQLIRQPSFAGAVVTMPFKKTIMPYLDGLEDLASIIGACNCIYLVSDGRLIGTNTDWRGVAGCLKGAGAPARKGPAMIVGAGGASRAAIYALSAELGIKDIYVVNRDQQEMLDLLKDVEAYKPSERPNLIHLQTVEQARALKRPNTIVGTVPDFEPHTPEELQASAILDAVLSKGGGSGVVLDMCYKPLKTRLLQSAERYGWETVTGEGIIGHQFREQWRLWCGVTDIPEQDVWTILQDLSQKHQG